MSKQILMSRKSVTCELVHCCDDGHFHSNLSHVLTAPWLAQVARNNGKQYLRSDFPAQLQDLISTKNAQGLNTLQLIISLPAYPVDIVSSQTVLLYSWSIEKPHLKMVASHTKWKHWKWTASTDYSEVQENLIELILSLHSYYNAGVVLRYLGEKVGHKHVTCYSLVFALACISEFIWKMFIL